MKKEKIEIQDLEDGDVIVWVEEFKEWKLINVVSQTMDKNVYRVTFDTGETRFYKGNKKFLLM